MASLIGKDCKISLGANQVVGMGTWSVAGGSIDKVEDSEFGDDWKTYIYGMKDGGQITFSGYYDATDTTGQDTLRTAHENNTSITDIRLYVDNTSYWIPKTTGPVSYIYVTAWNVSADKSGLVQTDFTCEISGNLELI